ncbi:NhaP-type Na+/H+ or K+/H+ antiporter [Limimaricola variabilis]|uniref:NhaP-type Na+/H+ or K+/H+ antiporter n=1 Tax=Limimaricola variabilis TaxID=1492771 RepID=A0ABR6HQR1_9RHOB|nr:cation:proton antiporter [Limimaricola variabilis]MBB3712897.1 NhaP-type Na+/H+ or K+/H+ antiporter [Limimaricola variabilis]WPY95842.1 cation:proton antiporter [Limimaricola variabilis]
MQEEAFFGFNRYHIALAVLGLVVIAARWLPRLVSRREPAAAPLMILFGAGVALLLPDLATLPDPREAPLPWELASELTVIVALFGAGMRIDDLGSWARWMPTIRMLGIAMPLTILSVALLGVGLTGMTVAGAILLGAVLAPTDPVLAADVQVGPPQEGEEHPVRFTLTTEAGLNDGLAFPFVYLGLIVAAEGLNPGNWLMEWLALDVVYRIAVGTAMGWLGGKALAFILFRLPSDAALAETGSGVVALAGILLCYGSTELVEGYGFIAVAILGLTLRRIEADHHFHRRLHDFSESIEHALTAVLLVALGTVLPLLFRDLSWGQVVAALALLLVIRPLAGWVSLAGSGFHPRDRMIVAVYGVRGIGSIYYLCYAGSHMEFVNEDALWSLVALVILISTILHGFSVGWAMEQSSETRERRKLAVDR